MDIFQQQLMKQSIQKLDKSQQEKAQYLLVKFSLSLPKIDS